MVYIGGMAEKTGAVTADEIRGIMGPQGDDLLDGIAGLVAARIAALVAERWRAEEDRIEPLLRDSLRHAGENADLRAEVERLRAEVAETIASHQRTNATLARVEDEIERLRAWEVKAREAGTSVVQSCATCFVCGCDLLMPETRTHCEDGCSLSDENEEDASYHPTQDEAMDALRAVLAEEVV
jgi:DNA repair exonuclease SbcCD ATPase subunit